MINSNHINIIITLDRGGSSESNNFKGMKVMGEACLRYDVLADRASIQKVEQLL